MRPIYLQASLLSPLGLRNPKWPLWAKLPWPSTVARVASARVLRSGRPKSAVVQADHGQYSKPYDPVAWRSA